LCLAITSFFQTGEVTAADIGRPADPFVYLFDTGTAASKPWPGSALAARSGWTTLAEDDLTHRFAGDVAMVNDKLVIVVRRHGPGAEVYSSRAGGWRPRAALMLLTVDGRRVAEEIEFKALENQPGAAVLEVSGRTADGGRLRVTYRLTTGRAVVEVVPSTDGGRLVVWTRPQWLVVPEFLADDMVFGPQSCQRSRMNLPTEQLLLHMLDGSDAMLMCVWSDGSQPAAALFKDTASNRRLGGCEICCGPERPVWLALLEGAGIWHASADPTTGAAKPARPRWEPPFPANWRLDRLEDGGFATASEWDDGAAPASPDAPPLLVYPIDRSRETPLTTFTPGDVLRDTLGVGPCQYVLQCEGLADPERPTPESVAANVDRVLRKAPARHDAEQIRRQLDGAVEQVRQAEARIGRYAKFAAEVETLVSADANAAATLAELTRSVARFKQIAAADADSSDVGQQARRLADAILALVDDEDPVAELKPLSENLHRLGTRQSRALAGCRLTVRWLREQARTQAAGTSNAAATAREIQTRCEQLLKQT
jgi:hypothetical protein